MSTMVMAWRNLSRRKMRTGLTIGGIFVGVALILVLLSLVAVPLVIDCDRKHPS